MPICGESGQRLWYRQHHAHHDTPLHAHAALWLIPECIGIGSISYLSTFEGMGILSLSGSAIAVAILSLVVLSVAAHSQLSETDSRNLLEAS